MSDLLPGLRPPMRRPAGGAAEVTAARPRPTLALHGRPAALASEHPFLFGRLPPNSSLIYHRFQSHVAEDVRTPGKVSLGRLPSLRQVTGEGPWGICCKVTASSPARTARG